MSKIVIEGNIGTAPSFVIKGDNKRLELFVLENRNKKDKETGEVKNLGTLPHNVVLFGERAELWKDTFKKGMRVLIAGEMQPTNYQKNGANEMSVSVVVDSIAVIPFGVGIEKMKNNDQPF